VENSYPFSTSGESVLKGRKKSRTLLLADGKGEKKEDRFPSCWSRRRGQSCPLSPCTKKEERTRRDSRKEGGGEGKSLSLKNTLKERSPIRPMEKKGRKEERIHVIAFIEGSVISKWAGWKRQDCSFSAERGKEGNLVKRPTGKGSRFSQ